MRPYRALFATQFQLMLQYRTAALAGFVTQCWWGGIKVMVLTAFFSAAVVVSAPMSLAQAITYIWLAQGFLVLQPWNADAEVAAAMRTGAIGLERVRPVDLYAWWFTRAASTMVSRAAPRAVLMVLFAGAVLPAIGLAEWGLRPPASWEAFGLFLLSLALAVPLSAAVIQILNVLVVATLNDRGINTMAPAIVILLSGSEIPLPLLPEAWQPFLRLQPFAGLLDTPFRIYSGHLGGLDAVAALGLQVFWIAVFVMVGRWALGRSMRSLEVQGG